VRCRRYAGSPSTTLQKLIRSQGLHALSQLGVDHRDVSIGNVLLGTDPERAAGFISDLDLSSISKDAIKEAYPNDYDAIMEQLKDGEWRTVSEHHSNTFGSLSDAYYLRRGLHSSWPVIS
jgi:hypothetical protein